MTQPVRATALVPSGFALERVIPGDAMTEIVVRAKGRSSQCPDCGVCASTVHSRYSRRLGDPPFGGRPLRLTVMARRFRCSARHCKRGIFTKRFDSGAVAPWSRRTPRLDLLVFHLILRWEDVRARALQIG